MMNQMLVGSYKKEHAQLWVFSVHRQHVLCLWSLLLQQDHVKPFIGVRLMGSFLLSHHLSHFLRTPTPSLFLPYLCIACWEWSFPHIRVYVTNQKDIFFPRLFLSLFVPSSSRETSLSLKAFNLCESDYFPFVFHVGPVLLAGLAFSFFLLSGQHFLPFLLF